MKKKLLSLFMIAVMMFALVSTTTFADNTQELSFDEITSKVQDYAKSLFPLEYGGIFGTDLEIDNKYIFSVDLKNEADNYFSYNKITGEIKYLFGSQQGYARSIQEYDKFDNWSEAYETFLLYDWYRCYGVTYMYYDNYKNEYMNYDANYYYDSPIKALLYDMNLDSIPELIVYNGSDITATSTNYVYTFSKGKMKCCGRATVLNGGGGIEHFGNKIYSGLYDSNGRGGSWTGSYFYLKNDIVEEEQLYYSPDFVYMPDNMQKTTNDETLYNLFYDTYINNSFEYVEMTDIDSIQSMGWNSFLRKYGYNNSNITVILNGQKLNFDQPPIIIDGRTLVPLRAIFEALGATVDWDGNTQTVTATRDNTVIKITIGDNKLYVNNNVTVLDVPAQIVNDRTLVPVRAVSEAFGCNVDWDGDTQTVIITK